MTNKNINTNSLASTNNASKEENVMKANMTEICTATCDYHCIHWNECPFGKGEDDPTAGIYTTYAPDTDITFIMQDTTLNGETATTRVVGFYHGEPNDAATERFYGKLMADYGPVDEV